MYALVDCNNFFASCERVFQPQLIGKPIVILSNNDGCIISRSDEARALGIPMGAPEFKVREELKQKGVKVTAILPGATWTDSWAGVSLPEVRLMQAKDVAIALLAATKMSSSAVMEEIVLRPQLGDL